MSKNTKMEITKDNPQLYRGYQKEILNQLILAICGDNKVQESLANVLEKTMPNFDENVFDDWLSNFDIEEIDIKITR